MFAFMHAFLFVYRLWTRGYDVYTPNKVVVVLDNSNVPAFVGSKGDGSREKERYEPLAFLKNGMVSSDVM